MDKVVRMGPGEEKEQDQMKNQWVVERMGGEKVQHLLYLYPYWLEADRSDNLDALEHERPADHNPQGVPQWSQFAEVGKMSNVKQE
jgi:hypothetical protein